MSSVLVGMFDTRAAAEEARTKLTAVGLTPGQVTWNSEGGATTGSAATAPTGTTTPEKEGMFSHFFHSIFGSDDTASSTEHASTYQEALTRGGFGLTVTAVSDADIDRATDILDDCGAFDVDERSQQWKSEGWSGAAATTASTATAAVGTTAIGDDLATGATRKLSIVEESLAVGKRTVGRGGVRVFSRVVEVPVQETVHLRQEQADVQRKVVDRPATEADFAAFKEGSIEVRSSSEEAVVSKSARVVGEVEVGTKVTERDEVVRDTVRKTEVDVEQIPAGAGAGAVGETSTYASNRAPTGSVMGGERSGALDTGSTLGRTGSSLTGGSANLDPITGEPGAHPVGTGVGAVAGGMAAGAAVGTVAGPVGTAVGAAAGAVVGGLAGKGVAEKIDPTTGKRM